MIRFFPILLFVILLCSSRTFAEEKTVTTPLLTALSSTTVSGYVDTSAPWNPGAQNVDVILPNGKTSSVTPRDLLALRWAMKRKQLGFLRTFIGVKQRLSTLDADEFDAKYLQLLLGFSKVPAWQTRQILGVSPSPF